MVHITTHHKRESPAVRGFQRCNGGGSVEIRTLGQLPVDGFQDRCLKPLGHAST